MKAILLIAICFLAVPFQCPCQATTGPPEIGPLGQGGAGLATEQDVERYLRDGVPLPSRQIGPVHIQYMECSRPVSFRGVVFTDEAIFNVNFKANADFSNAEFQQHASFAHSQFKNANFTAAAFRGSADFTGTQFAVAYFWRAFFDGVTKFVELRVRPGDESENQVFPGESNFSFAKFAKEADFTRAIFDGPVYFVGTRFAGPVGFGEVKFQKSVQFRDFGENVTIARGDIANIVNGRWAGPVSRQFGDLEKAERDQLASTDDWLFNRLLKAGVLHKSGEQMLPENAPPALVSFADFPAGQSETEWRARLAQARLTQGQSMAFDVLRNALALPMFPPDSGCSFELTEFPEQDQPHFRDADLSRCRFLYSTVAHAKFVSVRWDRQPMLFGQRAALFDERHASTRRDFLELERLYTALQSESEKDQTAGSPDEFQFGAMEMARRAGSGWRTFHKYLNGYNTSLLLPVIWLVLFICGVFPLIYVRLGVAANYTNALLHSLYLSSLLKDEKPAVSSTTGRLAQAAQTLIIGFLVTAAGFVEKRKLGL